MNLQTEICHNYYFQSVVYLAYRSLQICTGASKPFRELFGIAEYDDVRFLCAIYVLSVVQY